MPKFTFADLNQLADELGFVVQRVGNKIEWWKRGKSKGDVEGGMIAVCNTVKETRRDILSEHFATMQK
jgi:hypothetical protein